MVSVFVFRFLSYNTQNVILFAFIHVYYSEFREFPRPQSGVSYRYEDVRPAMTTFGSDDDHKYTDLKKG